MNNDFVRRWAKFIFVLVPALLLVVYGFIYFLTLSIGGKSIEDLQPYTIQDGKKPTYGNVLKVMTLNLAHGRGNSVVQKLLSKEKAKKNLEHVARIINQIEPDIIAYQEIDKKALWSGNFDHLRELAFLTKMPFSVQGVNVESFLLKYGTALASRYAMLDAKSYTFSPSPPTFPKGWTKITIPFPNESRDKLDIISVHLDFSRKKRRLMQIRSLISQLESSPNPLILMGDFNCGLDGEEDSLRILMAELNLKTFKPNDQSLTTFPHSGQRIDWILISDSLEFLSYSTAENRVSDHLAVIASITLGP